jgi:hypothetical protein
VFCLRHIGSVISEERGCRSVVRTLQKSSNRSSRLPGGFVMTSDRPDRTVHASCDSLGLDLVRYDKAGKWYIEPRAKLTPRRHVRIRQAAEIARYWRGSEGGSIYLGKPGGSAFDWWIQQMEVRHDQ